MNHFKGKQFQKDVIIVAGSVAKFKIKIIFPNNSIIYAGIPKSTLISMQTEKPKRVPSFRLFLYKPRIASMPLIAVEVSCT
ncbi:hypothetical protein, partial [Enterococcus faecalis]